MLHAERPVSSLELPELTDCVTTQGRHVQGRHNGKWVEANNVPQSEIYLPQRYKRMFVSVTNPDVSLDLEAGLSDLDSKYAGARQIYKLRRLQSEISQPFTSVVNISSTGQDSDPVSGSFYLLSSEEHLYAALIFDTSENSVQLTWGTFDFITSMRSRGMHRYVFYPLPTLTDRPLFLHTQTLCARWWRFIKSFGSERHGFLRAANALEVLLYKDPDVPTNRR